MNLKEMSKEELELLSYKDMTYYLLQDEIACKTSDLFKEIINLLGLSENFFQSKIGDYYTSLTTDKRFILLPGGIWDLRERHTSDKVIIALEDEEEVFGDEEVEEEDKAEPEEEFDKVIEDEEAFDDEDDDLKDLVILDEEELELEQ